MAQNTQTKKTMPGKEASNVRTNPEYNVDITHLSMSMSSQITQIFFRYQLKPPPDHPTFLSIMYAWQGTQERQVRALWVAT
jgi:hypothetical protein